MKHPDGMIGLTATDADTGLPAVSSDAAEDFVITENVESELYEATVNGKLAAGLTILRATWQARRDMRRRDVRLLVGFGGYPSFAPALAAKSLALPLLLALTACDNKVQTSVPADSAPAASAASAAPVALVEGLNYTTLSTPIPQQQAGKVGVQTLVTRNKLVRERQTGHETERRRRGEDDRRGGQAQRDVPADEPQDDGGERGAAGETSVGHGHSLARTVCAFRRAVTPRAPWARQAHRAFPQDEHPVIHHLQFC